MKLQDRVRVWWRLWCFSWRVRHVPTAVFQAACQEEIERTRQQLRVAPASRELYQVLAVLDELELLVEEKFKEKS